MTVVTTLSFGLILVAALFSQSLYSYQSVDIIRLQKSGQAQLEFSTNLIQDELLIKYDRQEYMRDLTLDYMPYLQSELDENPSVPGQPGLEDKGLMTYRNYLLKQQTEANRSLRLVEGLSNEDYYFALYAPSYYGSGFDGFSPNETENYAKAFEPMIASGLVSTSPFDRAFAQNLQGRLPVRLDAFSASGLLYKLLYNFRFFLILFPLVAVLLLFDPADRNLRSLTAKLILQKILACFIYCSAAILIMRLLIYGILVLRFGDGEGAMYLVPPWTQFLDQAGPIGTLREHLGFLTLMDVSFLLFVTTLTAGLVLLTGDGLSAATATLLSLLLPGVGVPPILAQNYSGFFTPFHYLFWDTRLSLSGSTVDHASAEFLARPQSVLLANLGSVLVILVALPWLIRLQKVFALSRDQRRPSQNQS